MFDDDDDNDDDSTTSSFFSCLNVYFVKDSCLRFHFFFLFYLNNLPNKHDVVCVCVSLRFLLLLGKCGHVFNVQLKII